MVIDNIKNQEKYYNDERFKKAFEYLSNIDMNNITTGIHNIEGNEIYAITNKYTTKDIHTSIPMNHICLL